MNAKILTDYLAAASACEPEASFAGPRELAAAVAAAAPDAEWELGLGAGDASALRLALRSPAAPGSALARTVARVLGPKAGRPPLAAVWSSKDARWLRAGAGRARRLAKPFSAALFDEPVASALAAFNGLAPIAEVQSAAGRPGWTLVLAAPLAWPLFLRCDVASAFAPRAAQLSLLLRDARVAALDFDGDVLWARLTD